MPLTIWRCRVGRSRCILEVEHLALAVGFNMQDEGQEGIKCESSISNLTN